MTRDELIAVLRACLRNNSDPEVAHSDADEALIEFIGDAEITRLYEQIEKWYA